MYCHTALRIQPAEKHWAVPPRYCYMQDNAVLWKVGRGGGDDSDSSGAETDENIGQEEGKYKKATFFLMVAVPFKQAFQ